MRIKKKLFTVVVVFDGLNDKWWWSVVLSRRRKRKTRNGDVTAATSRELLYYYAFDVFVRADRLCHGCSTVGRIFGPCVQIAADDREAAQNTSQRWRVCNLCSPVITNIERLGCISRTQRTNHIGLWRIITIEKNNNYRYETVCTRTIYLTA
jgi:hypothetical protein